MSREFYITVRVSTDDPDMTDDSLCDFVADVIEGTHLTASTEVVSINAVTVKEAATSGA